MKTRRVAVPCVIYPQRLLLCIGDDHVDVMPWLKKLRCNVGKSAHKKLMKLGSATVAHTVELASGDVVVWMQKPIISWLSHELVHATGHVLEFVGVPYAQRDNEAAAYLTEYLTRQALKLPWGWRRA